MKFACLTKRRMSALAAMASVTVAAGLTAGAAAASSS